jgi:type I restriction enzyme, R subunit
MPVDHTEKGFEQAIEDHLVNHGNRKGDPEDFHASLGLDAQTLVEFLKASQPDGWARLVALDGAESRIVEAIVRNLGQRGMLDCLGRGVTNRDVKLRLAYFQSATRVNPETLALDGQNIKGVTRQAHYGERVPALSTDMVLSLNRLPNE